MDGPWSRKGSPNTPTLPLSRPETPLSRKNSNGTVSSAGSSGSSSNGSAGHSGFSWTAKASNTFTGYSQPSKKFLGKHLRKLSTTLPTYIPFSPKTPGTPYNAPPSPVARARMLFRRFKLVLVLLLLVTYWFTSDHITRFYRRKAWLGGGEKFVIILATNPGGGVHTWKGGKEWASERASIANKQRYAARWGYNLVLKDVKQKKKYAHEWREGWEKVDVLKEVMREYPKAEWFWWLDLHTFIMEPSISLQKHVFNRLGKATYRDINLYNPLNITHPFPRDQYSYLSEEELSPVGDGKESSINLIVPQDCGGFNLGSFFIRRSEWTTRLLDIWWDPVGYEQNHMKWEHKDQDALEHIYTNQPWIRSHTAFIPQRMINSFPPGACSQTPNDPRIFYAEKDRDFLVNMAGCEWGRDCWTEMYTYKVLSEKLNAGWRARWFGKK